MNDRIAERDRIAAHAARPALLTLHWALSRLGSVMTVMNTGAHPDDEQSGLLAWLRYGLGLRVVIACATRGEGGQNILGPERDGALGILRSRELEEAARVLDADIAWLGHGPEDAVRDFGFSKDGDATFARWGEARIVGRLVHAYRRWRPDVVIPTFLDVPGQHGHHRAMTRAAEAALDLAADPRAYPEQIAAGLTPWRVAKYYLPGWSGGGATYDDAQPPPPATVTVEAPRRDPATGAAWDRIGEQSRFYHASQGMGRWPDSPKAAWPLHLKRPGGLERTVTEGLAVTLADLAAIAGKAGAALTEAEAAVRAARGAFPDRDAIIPALIRADQALARAERLMDAAFAAGHGHRLARTRRDVATALFVAAGLEPLAVATPSDPAPGGQAEIRLSLAPALSVHAPVAVTAIFTLPEGAAAGPVTLAPGDCVRVAAHIDGNAPLSRQFFAAWSARGGNRDSFVTLTADFAGRPFSAAFDFETPLAVRPAAALALDPDAVILPTSAPVRALTIRASVPAGMSAPAGWSVRADATGLEVVPPAKLEAGLYTLPAIVGGRPAMRRHRARFAHVGGIDFLTPEALRLLSLDLKLPEGATVAYIGGGDRVGLWLGRMGADVTVIDRIRPGEDFSAFTTVLIGVVAFGSHPDLPGAVPRLHRFVAAGGHLVTLYQRPDQGWDAQGTPPRPLKIGTPSLRWRVTDPTAPVAICAPDHPLLTWPNRIGAADFEGWDKERAIYAAAEWDDAYQPLLALGDAGEAPLRGTLVSGRIGRGRHTHVALVLHHQLDHLVPGAFRLLANLIQPARGHP